MAAGAGSPGLKAPRTHLLPRWIFLRCLGVIYFSAFYSLIFQIKGMIGPDGILPAAGYLRDVANYYPGLQRFWFAPTLLWFGAGNHALMLITWVGLIASVAVVFNLWPRMSLGGMPGVFSFVRCRRAGFLRLSV